jgi:hypothetical protein
MRAVSAWPILQPATQTYTDDFEVPKPLPSGSWNWYGTLVPVRDCPYSASYAAPRLHLKEINMILVRNVFHLKFGKAREAIAILKDGLAIQKKLTSDMSTRLLTDLTGDFYTIVLELTAPNLASLESTQPRIMGDKEWQANYQKLVSLVESGHREIYTIVE